jgi:hypothetical protein
MRYGPVHGWWMFPFERVIGALQKTNTNYKIGKKNFFEADMVWATHDIC